MATSTSTSTWTIGQLAERGGFTTSALRYYERCGLLAPVARTEAGYRLYDETSERRLRFIARAKQLGCTLEEIVGLLSLVDQDECRPVQADLHRLVTDKLAEATRRRRELAELTAKLQEAATQLGDRPIEGPCDDGCACHGGSTRPTPQPVVLGRVDDPAIACSLDDADVATRIRDWQDLLRSVTDRQPLPGATGIRLVLDPDVAPDQLLGLTRAEQGCCTFFAFTITIDQRGLALEVLAPDGAADLVADLFGPAHDSASGDPGPGDQTGTGPAAQVGR